MKYLIDPGTLSNGNGKNCEIVCKLCKNLHPQPLYGIIVPE